MIIDYFKKYERQSIIISILLVIIALFLIFEPGIALTSVVTIFGLIILFFGIFNIISYIFESREIKAFSNELVIGLLLTILGVIILLNKPVFISILPIITGMWVIIRSIMKFQLAINLREASSNGWGWILAFSIIMFILGIIIIANPFATMFTITRFIGIMILVTEIFNIMESIFALMKMKI